MNISRDIDWKGYKIEVTFDYYPPSKGAREYGTGLQLEPDEPATVELEQVKFNGEEIDGLIEDQFEDIEAHILTLDMEPDGGY